MASIGEMKRDRITVLELYLEQRSTLKDAVYRLLKTAADVRVDHSEFKILAETLNLLNHDSYSIKSEIRELKEGKQ